MVCGRDVRRVFAWSFDFCTTSIIIDYLSLSSTGSVVLGDEDTTSTTAPTIPKEPLVTAVRIYHTDDPISCSEMVSLLNEENFAEFTQHLKGLMAIYDNFQSESVNRSKIWLSLRALEEDLDVLAQIQGGKQKKR